jgi:AraC-like DNA-binding protein
MRYLRQVRLDRAHDDLTRAHGSVADTAYHWGFTNLGRFARAYRDRFGEFPAATLDGPPAGSQSGTQALERILRTAFYLVEVELRGLEPLTPCLQRSLATCSDLGRCR